MAEARCGRDRGFTLVEMIVVVVLMGLTTSAVAFAALAMLRTTPQSGDRVDRAAAQTSLLRWLNRDVTSVPPVAFTVVVGGVQPGAAVCPAAPGDILLGMGAPGFGAVDAFGVDYRLVDDAGVGRLVRIECSGTDLSGLTIDATVTLSGTYEPPPAPGAATFAGGYVTVELDMAPPESPGPSVTRTVKVTLAPRGVG